MQYHQKADHKKANTTTLHFDEYGSENNETLLFVHGAGLSGWMWHHQVATLKQDFHCIVPDLPSHGKSSDIQPFTISDCVEHLAQLIHDHAHDSKAHLVGLSLGALVCIELLSNHPSKIGRVAISAPPSGPFPGTSFIVLMTYVLMPLLKSSFVIKQTAKQLRITGEDFAYFQQDQKAMLPETMRQIAREIHDHRMPKSLHTNDTRLLALLAEHDNKINYRVVNEILRLIPCAQGWIAPHVGHAWNIENPQLFNTAVCQWVKDETVTEELQAL